MLIKHISPACASRNWCLSAGDKPSFTCSALHFFYCSLNLAHRAGAQRLGVPLHFVGLLTARADSKEMSSLMKELAGFKHFVSVSRTCRRAWYSLAHMHGHFPLFLLIHFLNSIQELCTAAQYGSLKELKAKLFWVYTFCYACVYD